MFVYWIWIWPQIWLNLETLLNQRPADSSWNLESPAKGTWFSGPWGASITDIPLRISVLLFWIRKTNFDHFFIWKSSKSIEHIRETEAASLEPRMTTGAIELLLLHKTPGQRARFLVDTAAFPVCHKVLIGNIWCLIWWAILAGRYSTGSRLDRRSTALLVAETEPLSGLNGAAAAFRADARTPFAPRSVVWNYGNNPSACPALILITGDWWEFLFRPTYLRIPGSVLYHGSSDCSRFLL